jgi:hypothetical protein
VGEGGLRRATCGARSACRDAKDGAASQEATGNGRVLGALVAGAAVAGGLAVCSSDHVPSIDYGWNHHGLLASYDYPRWVGVSFF